MALSPINWVSFAGFATLADFYLCFKPMSYRVKLLGYQPNATGNWYAAAVEPDDQYAPNPTGLVPYLNALLEMAGAVEIFPGSHIEGKWVAWPNVTTLGTNNALTLPSRAVQLVTAGNGPAGT